MTDPEGLDDDTFIAGKFSCSFGIDEIGSDDIIVGAPILWSSQSLDSEYSGQPWNPIIDSLTEFKPSCPLWGFCMHG